jgi:hypothetical protein
MRQFGLELLTAQHETFISCSANDKIRLVTPETELQVNVRRARPILVSQAASSDAQQTMKTDGDYFLGHLANFSPNTFERSFSNLSVKLELGSLLSPRDLNLLFEAAFFAVLCNLAFNGLGGCGSEIKPEREAHRTRLEWSFMAARGRFFACKGWKALSLARQASVKRLFLTVSVAEANLAR